MLANITKLKNFQTLSYPALRSISTTQKLNLDNILKVHDEMDFHRKVLTAEVPVLVGFYSKKCNLCKMQIPKTSMIANEYKDKILMAEVYVEDAKEVAKHHDIKTIPSHAYFKAGQMMKQLPGLQEMDNIRKFLQHNMEIHEHLHEQVE
ncbi:hypothetical protein PVAND_017506 [Polypedilum vanderplanki]|uniref:Thioredoxin n=1 Tax=Polypedilum vanderplanki TaxID=319348 RepID=S6BTQ4_POLVA|nr:hypothetical protein PVAND_017506 [Polypedilum vanderplanki]BAN67617.1 thioredoxin [Polypedilum vanderplanki]